MAGIVVYFDVETTGVHEDAVITQLAAIAVNDHGYELGSFNEKLQFDPHHNCSLDALVLTRYSPERWRNAIPPSHAVARFSAWLDRFKVIEKVSKRTGRPYKVAKLGGYNCLTFDVPRLKRLFADRFLPADPKVLDARQLAEWWFQFHPEQEPQNTKLGTVCRSFGIPFDDDVAHDALYDVRKTAALVHAIKAKGVFR